MVVRGPKHFVIVDMHPPLSAASHEGEGRGIGPLHFAEPRVDSDALGGTGRTCALDRDHVFCAFGGAGLGSNCEIGAGILVSLHIAENGSAAVPYALRNRSYGPLHGRRGEHLRDAHAQANAAKGLCVIKIEVDR